MKWIKASERLPEKEGNYFVKVQGVEYDNDNAEYTCGAFHHFVNTFEGKYFSSLPKHETVIEWLDETPDQPEPLCPHLDKNLKCKNMCLTRCVEGNRFWKEDGAVTEPLGEDAIEVLKDIMLKFGNAHDMLAKSKLTKEEYQPISSLLAKGKIELFNFYQLYRKQSKQ